jgi:glucoamylase
LASYRALQAGAHLATRLNDPGAASFYTAQASLIHSRLSDFRGTDGIWRATILADQDVEQFESASARNESKAENVAAALERKGRRLPKGRTSLDCAFPLAVIHLGGDGVLDPAEEGTLASVRAYVRSFEGLYGVNRARNGTDVSWTKGWAVGRYREDVYNGIGTSRGNPW